MEKEQEVTPESKPEEGASDIVIHSVESDLANLEAKQESIGEEVQESTEEVQPEKEEVPEDQKEEVKPKKSRAQRKIERQARELKELRAYKEEHKDEGHEQPVEPSEPNIDDFETFDEYEDKLKEYEELKDNPPKEELPEATIANEQITELFEDGDEDYENFSELVRAEDLAMTEDMMNTIFESDKPTDIAYYLATHKDEARDIAGMDEREMLKAMIKIELKVSSKKPKLVRTTQAPEPITPVNGGSVKGKSLNDPNLSFEDHEALLNSRKAKAAGGFI